MIINISLGFFAQMQGFGAEAKTRVGTLGFPVFIHTGKLKKKIRNVFGRMRSVLDLMKLGAHGGPG